ncbi:MAG: PAS domain S-box protein [Caldilineaceae bacterium]|nr:PAS domain S-box protein [Caldilineaceae bacterium]
MPQSLHHSTPSSAEDNPSVPDLYRAIFEQATDALFLTDAQGRCYAVNRQGCHLLGYAQADLLQRSFQTLLPTQTQRAPLFAPQELAQEQHWRVDDHLQHKQGDWLPVTIQGQCLPNGYQLLRVRPRQPRQPPFTSPAGYLQTFDKNIRGLLADQLPLPDLFQEVAQQLVAWLGDGCFIHQCDEAQQWLQLVAHSTRAPLDPTYNPAPTPLTLLPLWAVGPQQQVFHQGQPLFLTTASAERGSPATESTLGESTLGESTLGATGETSYDWLIIPFLVEEQVRGVFTLLRRSANWPPFTQTELQLVQDLLCHLALALQSAHLAQRVHQEQAVRQQTIDLLQEHETHFLALMAVSTQLVWATDTTGASLEALFFSQAAEPHPEQWLETDWTQRIHPNDQPLFEAAKQQAMATGSPYEVIHRLRMADGNYRWQRSRARPQYNAAGQLVRWYGITDDVHALRMAEEALRDEQEKLSKIAATVPGIIYVFRQQTDGALSLIYMSPGVTTLSGLSLEKIKEDMAYLFSALHPDDLAKIQNTIAQSTHQLQKQVIEFRICTPDQGEIWLESRAVPEPTPNGYTLWYGFITDITERKRVQEQLSYQADLLQNVTDAIIATDHNFHITSWNQGAEALYGWRAVEVMGKHVHTMLAPKYYNTSREQVLQQLSRTGHWKGEVEQRHKESKSILVMVSLSWIKDSTGAIIGTVGVARDISEQKRNEEALRQSEERFTKAFHANPTALSIIRLADGHIVDVNASFLQLYGYAREQVVHHSTKDMPIFLSQQTRKDLPELLHQRGRVHNYETSTLTQTGELLYVLLSMEIFDLAGEAHTLVTTIDITAHKQAEERLKLALSATQMGVWEWEVKTDQFFMSPECCPIFGLEQFGRSRQDFAHLIPPDELGPFIAAFDHALAQRTIYSYEFRIIRPDGAERWVYHLGRASYDQNGEPIRVLGIAQDITERRQALAAQAKLAEQLRQAQKMETIGRLAGGVAHDFNNLLTVIQGYCDLMLAKMRQDDPLKSKLEQIQKAGHRAAALTNQLLAFSRKQILSQTVLDLNHLVANLQEILGRLIGEDIILTTKLQPALWSITADPSQLEQVIMNLVVNARDAMPIGGHLTIETANVQREAFYLQEEQSESLSGPCVMLAVTDTGYGMDEQLQKLIFEPFFTTKEPGKGTGLGLATVYGIVKQSGGDILVYSEVGYGSTFKVYLPANRDRQQEQSAPTAMPPANRGYETILLVEDEEMVRKLVQTALEDKGYTIIEAHYTNDALTLARDYPGTIDLVMTDVVMPQMSGRELAKALMEMRPAIKVLFTSGYTDDAVVRHGLLTAEVEFLPKPFSATTLAQKVRAVLDKPASTPSPTSPA